MNEQVCLIGSESLVGVASMPEGAARDTAVVLLNAGFVHRVGPFRLNVQLARALASRGYAALRFDQSGLGDSPAADASLDLERRIVADVRAAVDHACERWGTKRVVLMGLCSGAVNAHLAAVSDARVGGVVQLDGYAYPTPTFVLRRYGERLADLRRLRRFLVRKTREMMLGAASYSLDRDGGAGLYLQELPPRDRVAAELRRLIARDVRMLFVFSGEARSYFNYAGQLRDAFDDVDFRGRVEVELVERADHAFALAEDRDRLLGRVGAWMQAHFS
jgi:pimeloyl-ACP methyl ester carboxylesterase